MRTVSYIDLVGQHTPLRGELLEAVSRVLEHGNFVLGPEVAQFEEAIARYSGTRFAVGLNSGLDALWLSLKAYGVGVGDEVITAPNSFLATAGAIVAVGARPAFVDVGDDLNIDPALIEAKITLRTKAIIPVHLTGESADLDPILAIARPRGLRVIEDAAQAIGAEYKGKRVGSLGDVGCFSMHPLKTLNACGDAGVVVTNDEELSKSLVRLRNHGLKNRDEASGWGYNSRLDTIQAAMLLVKMKYLEEWTESRRTNAHYYQRHLADLTNVTRLPQDRPDGKAVYHTFVIQAERRDELKKYLEEQGVESKIHYPIPLHLQQAAAPWGYKVGDFPVCEKQAQKILSLPVHQGLNEADLAYVCAKIREFYTR